MTGDNYAALRYAMQHGQRGQVDTVRQIESDIRATASSSAGLPVVPIERDYYSIAQAAALFGVSRVSIWRWIRDGRLPALRLGQRTTRIRRHDLDRLLGEIGRGGRILTVQNDRAAASSVDGAAPLVDWRSAYQSAHFVQFYEADSFLLDPVKDFIGTALRAGDVGIVIATPAHRAGVEERLRADGLDLDALRADGRYMALDAAGTMAGFMVDGVIDPDRFEEVVGGVIEGASAGRGHIRVFGEMVALLAAAGNFAAAVCLEQMWNELQRSYAFTLYCAYPMSCAGGEDFAGVLGDICGAHAHVIPAESYTTLPTSDERLRAITALQQQARSLENALEAERAARAAAEEALRVRDEFLSIAAHELKTPITSLSGYTQLLMRRLRRDENLAREQLEPALGTIKGQADKLSRLVGQLLDISRLEAGKLALERQATDVSELVEQVAGALGAWSTRCTIAVTAAPAIEAMLDPMRVEQVVTNLLDNAIKFSPEGSSIEVTLALAGPDGLELAVRDWGPGIQAEQRQRLFERFYQAHNTEYQGGLGLGLYISRQIVELHGGEIRAEFPVDGGTRFVVWLPRGLDG